MAAKKAPIVIEGVSNVPDKRVVDEAKSTEPEAVAAAPTPKSAPKQSAPNESAPKASAPKASVPKTSAPKIEKETAAHKQGAPHTAVETLPERDMPAEPAAEEQQEPQMEEPMPGKASGGVGGWVSRMFPGHEFAVYGGVVGLVMAILIFVVGFWQMLFVSALVVVGVALGQALDGDPKIIKTIRRLIRAIQGSDNE